MIVIDLETTGLNPKKHQMVSLGAVDYKTGQTFYDDCRIYSSDEIDPEALKVNGFTEDWVRDKHLMTPKQLFDRFLLWSGSRSNMLAGCVVDFDISFLKKVHNKAYPNWDFPFNYRSIDLHSVAYQVLGRSLSLHEICDILGIEPEPEIHNALTGATKAYECLKILLNK